MKLIESLILLSLLSLSNLLKIINLFNLWKWELNKIIKVIAE